MNARAAAPEDADAIARIYNQGIEDRIATFETRLRSDDEIRGWFDGIHPIVVVEDMGQTIAFAATSSYRPRECYSGIAEFSVYVDPARAEEAPAAWRLRLSLAPPRALVSGSWSRAFFRKIRLV